MKEVKSKTTAKKTTASKKKVTSTDEAPKITLVKDIKKPKVTVEEEFLEPEENKRLILFIAIAVIIIIGIIIGLLVGCEPKEKELDDILPNDEIEDIVIDEVENEEEEETVEKVVSKTTTTSNETTRYKITYLYDNETKSYTTNITSGNLMNEYLPSGYESCTYYSDSKYTNSIDFSKAPTKDTTIYMVCSLLEYTVNYIDSEDNIISSNIVTGEDTYNYMVNSGTDYCNEDAKFLGWSSSLNNVITNSEGETIELTSDLSLKAVCGATTVKYTNKIVGTETEEDSTTEEDIIVEEEITEDVVLDETATEETTTDETIVEETVTEEETNEVVLGYTQEEVDNYVLPEHPNDVGLDTPTYFVPVEEETETSKKVVSDETEVLGESEIKISDVTGNTPEWYIPQIDDNVEEKEYIFTGWTQEEVNEETGETTDVPVEEDYKPSTEPDVENELNANWEMPVEDAVEEVEA